MFPSPWAVPRAGYSLAGVNLYVCWTTRELHLRPGGHPCANAYKALQAAGHEQHPAGA
jgi:hypothetical protein